MPRFFLAAAAVALSAPALCSATYSSYVAVCDSTSTSVVFQNYLEHDCKHPEPNVTNPLNSCEKAKLLGVKYTWKAFCNETDIWFENYDNQNCSGKSILTRDYVTNKCINCPLSDPINCKNGPFPF
eukprot:INCI18632.1.p1 GENE.INCI18632.1~~INCI18632.1.p1  ORF type:complete len:143 (-),score=17.17 INCI18632.1:82-459(-)